MAVDMWSENSSSSPRISFSHDLSLSDIVPVDTARSHHHHHRSRSSGLSSSFDFDFCPADNEPSLSADDFFCDGKILPTDINIKKKAAAAAFISDTTDLCSSTVPPPPPPPPPTTIPEPSSTSSGTSKSSSFWRFKRSTSCGSGGYGRSLCPLPLLSRSNSTGSAPNKKNAAGAQLKPAMPYSSYQKKPPLMRKTKLNPHVLNVPSGNMFGIGSVFFSGTKDNTRNQK